MPEQRFVIHDGDLARFDASLRRCDFTPYELMLIDEDKYSREYEIGSEWYSWGAFVVMSPTAHRINVAIWAETDERFQVLIRILNECSAGLVITACD